MLLCRPDHRFTSWRKLHSVVILAVAVAFSRAQRQSPGLLAGPLTSVSEFFGKLISSSASAEEAGAL